MERLIDCVSSHYIMGSIVSMGLIMFVGMLVKRNTAKKEEPHLVDDTLVRNKKIAIVGGGPAGLPLARLLQMRGANVKVYEREKSRSSRVQGGCLDMHTETGIKVIQTANLIKEFQRLAHSGGESTTVMDKFGNIEFHVPAIKVFNSRPEIDRYNLRDLFLNSLEPDTVQWDHHFISLTSINENQFELTFKNGKKVIADLVIGADGANSKIRPYITEITPKYSGVTTIQAEIENPEVSCPQILKWINKGALFVLGDEISVIFHITGDGQILVYVSAKQPEDWIKTSGIDFSSSQQVKTYLKTILASWNPVFQEMIDVTSQFIPRPIYGLPIDQHWKTKPNITLIGDAAHVMPPFAGEGANMAMLDALILANCLTSGKYIDIKSALEGYEIEMLKHSSEAAKLTRHNTIILHSPDPINSLFKVFLGRFAGLRYLLRYLIPAIIHTINFTTDLLRISTIVYY